MISRNVSQIVILLIAVGLLAGCSPAAPPTVGEIQAQPSTTIQMGETAILNISAEGTDIEFEWSVDRGTLSNNSQAAVVYTAPNSPGPDIVTVKVKTKGGEITRAITFNVEAPPTPTATETPLPTDTPTPSPIPEPIPCNNQAISENVFVQLAEVAQQFPFYGPVTEPRFSCEGVFDIVHSGRLAIRIEYNEFGTNYGFWGIGVPKEFPFDVSSYGEICFWAYAQEPLQSFHLRMKDISNREDGIIIVLDEENNWEQVCTQLTEFSDLGLQLDQLENINLGFDTDTHSAEIWVDDFELVE